MKSAGITLPEHTWYLKLGPVTYHIKINCNLSQWTTNAEWRASSIILNSVLSLYFHINRYADEVIQDLFWGGKKEENKRRGGGEREREKGQCCSSVWLNIESGTLPLAMQIQLLHAERDFSSSSESRLSVQTLLQCSCSLPGQLFECPPALFKHKVICDIYICRNFFYNKMTGMPSVKHCKPAFIYWLFDL